MVNMQVTALGWGGYPARFEAALATTCFIHTER